MFSTSSTIFRELYATFVFTHGCILSGCILAFPACLIPQLKDEGYPIDTMTQSILGSISMLTVSISTIFTTALIGKVGRKQILRISFLWCIVGMFLVAISRNVATICLGLIISASVVNCFLTISITYLSEVCHRKRRGALLNGTQLCFAMGAALIYVLNPLLCWRVISLVFMMISLSGFIQTFFIPETKYWYLLRGNIDRAIESLRWYQPDLPLTDADRILRTILLTIEDDANAKPGRVLELLKNLRYGKYMKPVLLGFIVTILRCGNGRVVFTIYLIDIMRDLEITYDTASLSTLFGIVEMVGPVVILAFIYDMKRKPVIYISSGIVVVCLSVAILHKILCNSQIYVIPPWFVVSCAYLYTMIVLSAYNTSMSIIVSEIQVAYYRAEITFLLFGIMCFFFWLYAFIFPYAEALFPIEYILIYFMANTIVALVLVYYYFPETSKLEFYENDRIKSSVTRFK